MGIPPFSMQIISKYYIPWNKIPKKAKHFSLSISYPQAILRQDQRFGVKAKINYLGKNTIGMLMLDFAFPSGIEPDIDYLELLTEKNIIERYEIKGNRIILYLPSTQKKHMDITYFFYAKTIGKYTTPTSIVYDYYTPHVKAISKPATIIIR